MKEVPRIERAQRTERIVATERISRSAAWTKAIRVAQAAVFLAGVGLLGFVAKAEAKPVLLISHQTDPADVSPGDRFDLRIVVRNDGDTSAKNTVVSLGLSPSAAQAAAGEGAPSGVPISVLESGSVASLGTIKADEREVAVFRLAADGRAASGAYNLAVKLQYDGGQAEQIIGLVLVRRPRLQIISFKYPKKTTAGKWFKVSVEIANAGNFKANGVSLSLVGPNLEAREKEFFVGTLEPGDSDTFETLARFSKPGSKTVGFEVFYLDDFNERQGFGGANEVRVTEAPSVPRATRATGFWAKLWAFIRALLGLGEARG